MTADVAPPLLVLACWAVPAVRAAPAEPAPGPARLWAARFAPPLAALALSAAWYAATSAYGTTQGPGAWEPFRLTARAWQLLPAGLLVGAGQLACAALLCAALGELTHRPAKSAARAGQPASQWAALQRSAWLRRASALPGAGTHPPLVPLAVGLLAAWAEQAAVFGVGVAAARDFAGPVGGWCCALLLGALSCRWPYARRSPRIAPVATLLTTVVDTALFLAVPLILPLAGARWAFLLLARSRQEPSSAGRPAAVTTYGG